MSWQIASFPLSWFWKWVRTEIRFLGCNSEIGIFLIMLNLSKQIIIIITHSKVSCAFTYIIYFLVLAINHLRWQLRRKHKLRNLMQFVTKKLCKCEGKWICSQIPKIAFFSRWELSMYNKSFLKLHNWCCLL